MPFIVFDAAFRLQPLACGSDPDLAEAEARLVCLAQASVLGAFSVRIH